MWQGTTVRVHILLDKVIIILVQLDQITRTIVHDLIPFLHRFLILNGRSLLCDPLAVCA